MHVVLYLFVTDGDLSLIFKCFSCLANDPDCWRKMKKLIAVISASLRYFDTDNQYYSILWCSKGCSGNENVRFSVSKQMSIHYYDENEKKLRGISNVATWKMIKHVIEKRFEIQSQIKKINIGFNLKVWTWRMFFLVEKKQMVCGKTLLVFPMVCSKWTQFPDLKFKIHQVQFKQISIRENLFYLKIFWCFFCVKIDIFDSYFTKIYIACLERNPSIRC